MQDQVGVELEEAFAVGWGEDVGALVVLLVAVQRVTVVLMVPANVEVVGKVESRTAAKVEDAQWVGRAA